MSDPSFIQARVIVQAAIADSSNPQFVDFCLNEAQREVARARKWPELQMRGFFNTVAAFDDGTVAVTEGDATVTLTGGTFPAAVASLGYRFALSTSDPWTTVRTRTDGTHVELAQTYTQDTDADTGYILYKSHYSLPSNVERIESMWLHDSGPVELTNAGTEQHVTAFFHYPSGPGVPSKYLMIERDASGNRQVLLGPETPDDIYRVEFVARRKVIDNQFAGNLDDSRWPLIVSRAKAMAYESDFFERSVAEMQRYEKLLMAEWNAGDDAESGGVRVGDTRVNYPNMPNMDNFMGRGTVEDPN